MCHLFSTTVATEKKALTLLFMIRDEIESFTICISSSPTLTTVRPPNISLICQIKSSADRCYVDILLIPKLGLKQIDNICQHNPTPPCYQPPLPQPYPKLNKGV